jgi:H+-transporting ATPase
VASEVVSRRVVQIWVAIVIKIIEVSLTGEGVADLVILVVLQVVNGVVGYVEEHNAGNAVAALKSRLQPTCRVIRHDNNGVIRNLLPARELVPGDVVELKLGNVVPADCVLLGDPSNPLHSIQVDESALTGESLPKTSHAHDKVLMSSAVKLGEIRAVVVATGPNTFFGKAAKLIAQGSEGQGRFQRVLFLMTVTLVAVGLVMCTTVFFFLLFAVDHNASGAEVLSALGVSVVLLIASVPVAMLVVSTAALAAGSSTLSEEKAIVTRLTAIEELAGISVLCSDKTGTLTLNKLSLNPPILLGDFTAAKLVFYASLSANRRSGEVDAIDEVILNAVPGYVSASSPTEGAEGGAKESQQRSPGHVEVEMTPTPAPAPASPREGGETIGTTKSSSALQFGDIQPPIAPPEGDLADEQWTASLVDSGEYEVLYERFIPFNPAIKRTESTIRRRSDGKYIRVTKGAPQVVINLSMKHYDSTVDRATFRAQVDAHIDDLADRGFRALGVAVAECDTVDDPDPHWELKGILSLSDPPRHDTAATIAAAIKLGIEVKMITGDARAIAKETLRRLNLGTKVYTAHDIDDSTASSDVIEERITEANGFAEVMPEHKFNIVQALRARGLVVGMTGDGVNDAPALKRADVGIAVSGATDAARAAADIVLTEPGLSVIIKAIDIARTVFQRLRVYCIYRIAGTMQILFFCFFSVLVFRPRDIYNDDSIPNVFVLTAASLVVITLLNDVCVITLTRDAVQKADNPLSWDLPELWGISTVQGLVALAGNFLFTILLLRAPPGTHDTFFGVLFGTKDVHSVPVTVALTAVYQKVALTDFLTVFSSRSRGWFWERPFPSIWLFLGGVVSLGLTTVFAEIWVFGGGEEGLECRPYASLTTWIFCLINLLVQDAAKVLAYKGYEYFRENRIDDVKSKATLSLLAATDQRVQRRRMRGTTARQPSGIIQRPQIAHAAADQDLADRLVSANGRVDFQAVVDEVLRLNAEVTQLRQELERARASAAPAAPAAASHGAASSAAGALARNDDYAPSAGDA